MKKINNDINVFVTVSRKHWNVQYFELHNMHVTLSIRDNQTKMFARVMYIITHNVGDD